MVIEAIAERFDMSAWSIKLMASILMGYPVAMVYRSTISSLSPFSQHLYMTVSGAAILFFNFGFDIYHSLINILFIYIIIHYVGVNKFTIGFVIAQQTAYLVAGCVATSTGEIYTVDWTTPQCVLCLRLIGLMWDLYDGTRPEDELSASQKISALKEKPSLLELLSFCYFFSSFLCGPQYTMRHYLRCLENTLVPEEVDRDLLRKSQISRTVGCVLQGFGCIAFYLYINRYFYVEMFTTKSFFEDTTFFQRICYMTAFGNFVLSRYVGVWKLAEGPCVLTGLGYDGVNEKGEVKQDALANTYVWRFITAASCDDLVNSFNTNTNKWMLEYVYKRLRFLNSRVISQVVTLFYLALWHGIHSGYFLNFFFEFTVLFMEKQLSPLVKRSHLQPFFSSTLGSLVKFIITKSVLAFIVGQALVVFCLLSYNLYIPVLWSVYFVPFIFCFWPLVRPVVASLLPPMRNDRKSE